MLAAFGMVSTGVVALSFLPGEIGAWARNLLAKFALVCMLLALIAVALVNQAYQTAKCYVGDTQACYYNSYTNYTVEGWTAEQLSAEYQKAIHNELDPKYYRVSALTWRRWALLRDEWHDGEVIKTRQLCLTTKIAVPASGDHCFDRQVLTGKHKGEFLWNPTRPKPVTVQDYNNATEIYQKLLHDWDDSIW